MSIFIDLDAMYRECGLEGKNVRIGVAVSGGRDSVALLHCLKSEGADVVAINVEHGIRGQESVADSAFVKELCKDMGVPLMAFSVDAPSYAKRMGYTLEQGARALRYEIFDRALNDGSCDLIALAHHLDDQVETMLMRMLRGTGIRGLVGMKAVSGRYVRPLLGYSRKDIDEYIAEFGLPYVEDSTNSDVSYTRNFLRAEIATLRTRFPSLNEAFMRLSRSAGEAENFILSKTPMPVFKDGEAYINIGDLSDEAVAKRLVMRAAEAVGVRQDIEERHFKLLFALAEGENGKHIELVHGLDVHRDGDRLAFAKRAKREDGICVQFSEGTFPTLGVRVELIDRSLLPQDLKGDGSELYIAASAVPDGAVLRRRAEGDTISKFGGGSKSLGDFLTDRKVPKRKRDRITVLALGNSILAAVGVDISADVKVERDTEKIYKLTKI